jgi:hypothetical protein
MYTQPFGSCGLANAKAFGNDTQELVAIVVGWQNLCGILTVLVESVDEMICQRCGLCTIEVKLCHTVG